MRTTGWGTLGIVAMVGWMSASPAAGDEPGAAATQIAETEVLHVYIGTYTGRKSKGIYLYRFNTRSGDLQAEGLAAEIENPTFLAVTPSGGHLYAVGEVSRFRDLPGGAVSAFTVSRDTGKLTLLNQQPSGGQAPCYISLDARARYALVANYTSGSVASLPIETGGRLGKPVTLHQNQGSGPNSKRQEGPHAHSIRLGPTGQFALSADLGTDKLYVYRFDAEKGTLTPHEPPSAELAPGAGPRHFAIHPSGRFVYVANELNSTITVFTASFADGSLSELQTLTTLPEGFKDTNYPADIHVHPSGRFLYSSNRGHDSIAIFTVDPQTGRLAAAGHESTRGKWPRNFALDPSGKWLIAANQNSDSLARFRIDPGSGRLEPEGGLVEAPAPACVMFVAPAARQRP